jgi:hypothetical protein
MISKTVVTETTIPLDTLVLQTAAEDITEVADKANVAAETITITTGRWAVTLMTTNPNPLQLLSSFDADFIMVNALRSGSLFLSLSSMVSVLVWYSYDWEIMNLR